MDNSFESVWFPKWLVLLGPGSCYPSGTAHFPHLRPKLPLESIDFSSLWWRKPWDYTSNIDITVKCQLCCGIPLKPVVSHLWETDLRSVMLSSRASSSHPCFSMWWEHPCFLNKIVSNCLFKSVLATPGLLRHSSRWAFNLMGRLFSVLGTLENQGFFSSCSHLPSPWGKHDSSLLRTTLWRGGLENLVVRMVHLSYFSESSEGGQDSACSSQQELAAASASAVTSGSHNISSLTLLFGSNQGTFCHFHRLWHRVCETSAVSFSFFHFFGIFFPLPSHLRLTPERFPPLKLSACPWEGDTLHWGLLFSAAELQSGEKLPEKWRWLVLKWNGLDSELTLALHCCNTAHLNGALFLIHNDVSEKRNLTNSNLIEALARIFISL